MFRFTGLFKPAVRATVVASALYLAQQARDYHTFKAEMQEMSSTPILPDCTAILASVREWLVFGRQSLEYARPSKQENKEEMKDRIKRSPLVIKSLGTYVDNEKHFELPLMSSSNFITQPVTSDEDAPRVVIKPEHMLSTDLDRIEDSAKFEFHLAKKQAFAGETKGASPFHHASIALRIVTSERPASPGAIVISGAEAKEIITRMNEEICLTEHCTMLKSNCYSAVLYGAVTLAKMIDEKPDVPADKKAKDIQAITNVITNFSLDNLGRGVCNNPTVRTAITKDLKKIQLSYKEFEVAELSTSMFSPGLMQSKAS